MAIFNRLTTNYRCALTSTCLLRRTFTTKNIPTIPNLKADIKKVAQKILPNIKITNPSVLASMAACKDVTTKLQTWTKTESGQNRIKDCQAITKLFLAFCFGLVGIDYYKHCKNQTIARDLAKTLREKPFSEGTSTYQLNSAPGISFVLAHTEDETAMKDMLILESKLKANKTPYQTQNYKLDGKAYKVLIHGDNQKVDGMLKIIYMMFIP